jgi:hypothetical protein
VVGGEGVSKFVGWQLFWLVVIGLFCVAVWRTHPPEFWLTVSDLIWKYRAIITGIGVLALVSFLALLTTVATNKSAELRERSNRRVLAEIEIAKFRQAWINEMRNDIALFSELTFQDPEDRNPVKEMGLYNKIVLRLNLELKGDGSGNYKEPLAVDLFYQLGRARTASRTSDVDAETREQVELNRTAGAYLKNEWTRLKSDLKAAQSLEVG